MKRPAILSNFFRPLSYEVDLSPQKIIAIIIGDKVGRPSRRITLHQKGLQVSHAKIFRIDKGEKARLRIDRINHLRRVEEVRLHTHDLVYPGRYEIHLDYSASTNGLTKLKNKEFGRESLPCIDEVDCWTHAKFSFK